jgi:DNA-binding response OmpR family regulator
MGDAFGRLLIVDDEEAVLDVLRDYFERQGHRVETVTSGAAALAALDRTTPDLVLLDIRMPGIDGLEVLRKMRARASSVPIVMVTANEDLALARLTLKLGAFDYVSKPFDFAYLDRVVTAGLVQTAMVAEPAKDAVEDAWRALTLRVFRATRAMAGPARSATGERLESAVLAAASSAAAGAPDAARRALHDLELIAWVASELGDLGVAEREALERSVGAARATIGTA